MEGKMKQRARGRERKGIMMMRLQLGRVELLADRSETDWAQSYGGGKAGEKERWLEATASRWVHPSFSLLTTPLPSKRDFQEQIRGRDGQSNGP